MGACGNPTKPGGCGIPPLGPPPKLFLLSADRSISNASFPIQVKALETTLLITKNNS